MAAPWTVVLPVKPWDIAKSRLAVPDAARRDLAHSFALDALAVLQASEAVGTVVVVTTQLEVGRALPGDRGVLLRDRPLLASDPLGEAIEQGRSWAQVNRADAPLAVVPADLPALGAPDLDAVLLAALEHDLAFVPDGSGRGTTLLTAATARHLRAAYGPKSAQRHSALGARPLLGVAPGARQDVDTAEDMLRAEALGVGPHTAAALERCRSVRQEVVQPGHRRVEQLQ